MNLDRTLARKLSILWVLYFVQGLPFGFQVTALPIYLRKAGVSLTGIGLASALAVPWMLKLLWGPLVDRYGSLRFGRRRSWIVPLQTLLVASCLAGSLVPAQGGITILLLVVLAMNFCAATMDVAVDGLAVDLLDAAELGQGNIAQVVGFKLGMLTGGGLLLWLSRWLGWHGLFLSMAGIVVFALAFTLRFREGEIARTWQSPTSETPASNVTLGAVLRLLRRSLASSGALWLLLLVGTYKLGETMAVTMFTPFLVDAGFHSSQIGLWVGTWGMLFSIAGSVVGGLLASRLPLLQAVGWTAAWRVLPLVGQWWLTLVTPTAGRVVFVTCSEHFFGGALTTAMFAYMMSRVDRRIGATHYTLLATVEVWGKLPVATISGAITDATSYSFLFALAALLSVAYLGLLWPLRRSSGAMPVAAG